MKKKHLKSGEIYNTDTCQFFYRINLATYFLKHGNDSAAIKEINLVLDHDIKNTDAMTAKVIYLKMEKRYEEAAEVCRYILEINAGNKFAKSMISQLEDNK